MKLPLAIATALTLLSAAAASASPGSATPAPGPPGPPVPSAGSGESCKVGGAPLLVLNHRLSGPVHAERTPAAEAARPKVATWTTTVYTNGSWNHVDVSADGTTSKLSGCMPAATVAKLRGEVAAATWKTTPAQVACDAISATIDELVVAAKTVWTEEMCPSKVLDKASEVAYADVKATVEAAVTSAKPPCCKH